MPIDITVARLDDARIVELRGLQYPRCDWRALFTLKGEPLSEADEKRLDDYFRVFLLPQSSGGCINCGATQGGDAIEAALGIARFTWGLTHGEGFCSRCRYPARAYHYGIGPIKRLNLILQVHPDELILGRERAQ